MKNLLRLGYVLFVLPFCLHCSAAAVVSTNLQLTLELRDGSCVEIPMNLIKKIKVSAIPKPKPLPDGLVALWSGEGNANDSTGSNNGTLTGSATFGPGKVGQGFVFDGNNGSGVTLGNPASLQLQDFTIEAWIKRGSDRGVSAARFRRQKFGRFTRVKNSGEPSCLCLPLWQVGSRARQTGAVTAILSVFELS